MTVQNKAIKLLSLILALLMIFGAMPLSVFAEGVSNEATDPISETEQNVSPQTNDVMGPLLQSSGVEDSPSQNQVPGLPEYSGSENKPVGDIEISEDAFRMRLNQDGKSYTVVGYLSSSDTMHIPATYIGQNGEYPVTRIEEFAFQNKKNLKYVTIPDSIEYIGTEAFSGCDALVCNQYDNAQYLGSPANDYFYLLRAGGKDAEGKDINKTTMTSVEIHPDTKFIASYSFQNCMELTEIVVPESVVQIGFKAFRHVDSLKSITLPFVGETGTGTENSHFGYVFGAQTFGGNISYVPTGLTQVSILDGERITKNAIYGVDMVEEMTLPFVGEIPTAAVNTHIGYMFGFDTYEGNANLPQSLKKVTVLGGAVGDNAFRGCVGISEVMLSDDVTCIGASAFYRCTKSDCKLYQNGRAITGCTLLPSEERTNEEFSILYFEVPVDRFVAEVPVEARIGLTYGLHSESKVMTTAFLNIDVINFSINEDDVDLDAGELEVNLSQGGGIISTLLGNGSWSFSLGDHMSFNTVIDGNEIKLSLNAEYDKTSSKDYGKNYQAGYEANILSNYHKNTWRFESNQGNLPLIFIVDKDGTVHTYSMNIYFAKTSAPDGYCYYRCSINEELPDGKASKRFCKTNTNLLTLPLTCVIIN